MKGKVFIGAWVGAETRKRLKIACVVHGVYQEDVIDLLILKWLEKPHVDNVVKELINGREEKENK